MNDELVLKNKSFLKVNLENEEQIKKLIYEMKIIYEDHWKNHNKINTSIKLPHRIKVESSNDSKIDNFEKILNETDLIYDFSIKKFDKNFIIYEIIYNGLPDFFLKSMRENNFTFDIQNKDWILK